MGSGHRKSVQDAEQYGNTVLQWGCQIVTGWGLGDVLVAGRPLSRKDVLAGATQDTQEQKG